MMENIDRLSDLEWWETGVKIYNETRCSNCNKGNGRSNPFGREGRCMNCNSVVQGTFPRVVVRK